MSARTEGDLHQLIVTPLEGEPCGEDPRYDDRFAQAKTEIERLSGADFKRIQSLCRELLGNQTKDLRVLGYLALATTYEEGLQGLTQVCDGYAHVLREWWETCHPRRENARLTAITWLDNPRFVAFLDRARDGNDLAALKALQEAVTAVEELITERFPDNPPRLSELQNWLQERQKSDGRSAGNKRVGRSADVAPNGGRGGMLAKVGSDKELNRASREIIGYLRQQGDYGRMVAFARALRWGGLMMPPNEDGATRIPAPRPAALAEVETAMERDAWLDAFLACESVFMEPGGQFCFQVQQWVEMAAERMGQPQVAQLVKEHARGLLERLPNLLELRYENGTPFAAPGCLDWVETLAQGGRGGETASDRNKDWSKCEQLAREAAAEKGLAAGLAVLDTHPAITGLARCQVQLGKAQLCLANGRAELAVPVLDALSERVECEQAATWVPEFALQVWRTQQKALRSAGKQAGLTEAEVKKRLTEVKGKICRTDLNAAIRHF